MTLSSLKSYFFGTFLLLTASVHASINVPSEVPPVSHKNTIDVVMVAPAPMEIASSASATASAVAPGGGTLVTIPLVPSSVASGASSVGPLKVYSTMGDAAKDGVNPLRVVEPAASATKQLTPNVTEPRIARFDPFKLDSYVQLLKANPEYTVMSCLLFLGIGYFVFKPNASASSFQEIDESEEEA